MQLVITPVQCIYHLLFFRVIVRISENLDTVYLAGFHAFGNTNLPMHNYSKDAQVHHFWDSEFVQNDVTQPAQCLITCFYAQVTTYVHPADTEGFLYVHSLAKQKKHTFPRSSLVGQLQLWKSLWSPWQDNKKITIVWEMRSEMSWQLDRISGNPLLKGLGCHFKPRYWD